MAVMSLSSPTPATLWLAKQTGFRMCFVRDMQSNTTLVVSQGAIATNAATGGGSEGPEMTPDGRYVVFYSSATNLVPGVRTTGDIYVRDLIAATTVCCTTNARSELNAIMGTTNAVFGNYAISQDGKYVAYLAGPSGSTQSAAILLRHDLTTGSTQVVSTNANASAAGTPNDSRDLDMTPDGRLIAFVGNVNGTTGATTCICVWDGQTGETVVASGNLSNSVPPDSICAYPTIDSAGTPGGLRESEHQPDHEHSDRRLPPVCARSANGHYAVAGCEPGRERLRRQLCCHPRSFLPTAASLHFKRPTATSCPGIATTAKMCFYGTWRPRPRS